MRAEESMRPVRRRRKCQREEWATSSGRSCSAVWMIIQIMIQVRQVLLCCLHGHPSFSTEGRRNLSRHARALPNSCPTLLLVRCPAGAHSRLVSRILYGRIHLAPRCHHDSRTDA